MHKPNKRKVIICISFYFILSQFICVAQDRNIAENVHANESTIAQEAPALIRVNEYGYPDPSFNGGKGIFAYVKDDINVAGISDLYLDYKNRIQTVGGRHFTFTRFKLNGKRDMGFNFHGIQRIKPKLENITGSQGIASRLTQNISYKVLTAGDGYFKFNNKTYTRPLITRLDEEGQLDHTFGEEGVVDVLSVLGFENRSVEVNAVDLVDITKDRYVFLGTLTQDDNNSQLILSSFHLNGYVDTSFAGKFFLISRNNENLKAKQLLEYGDYLYVVAESKDLKTKKNSILICRVNQNTGKLDISFGDEGFLMTRFYTGNINVINAGSYGDRLAVVGLIGDQVAIARFNLSLGKLDIEFSGDGKRVISNENFNLHPRDIIMNYNKKIFICGYSTLRKGGKPSMFLLSIKPDGDYDPSLSLQIYSDFTTETGEIEAKQIGYFANKMFLEKSGYILIGGSMSYGR